MLRWSATGLGALAGVALAMAWWGLWVTSAAQPDDVAFSVIGLITVALGVVVAWRAVSNPVGLLLVVIGALHLLLVARTAWYWFAYYRPDLLPQPNSFVLALNSNLGATVFLAVACLLIVFPDGRVPSPGWRWPIVGAALTTVLLMVGGSLSPTTAPAPYQHVAPWIAQPTPAQQAFTVGSVALFAATLVTMVVLAVVRVRAARGLQRLQLRWALLGTATFLFYPLVCGVEVILTGAPQNGSLLLAYLGMTLLPVGIAVGMLRHDLFDVDRAMASVVTWAIVATTMTAVFALLITVAGALLGSVSPWIAAASTAVCALVLAPLHRWLSKRIGRRLYPLRRAALDAIETLERRVNTGKGIPEELEPTLRAAVRDPGLHIGYLDPDSEPRAYAMAGLPTATPIAAGEERIGVLFAPSLTAGLRREIAAACVMLVSMARLRQGLRRSITEIEASRGRIVAAEDAARRRFEHDLHDGAQQRLVSLGMTLRLAQRRLPSGQIDVADVLDEAVAELGTAIAELRRLAHGIRPSVLDDGLVAALNSLARVVPVEVTFEVDANLDALPISDPVAATAYYVAAEALTNAVKHAGAELISLRAGRTDRVVRLVVSDDGGGGANPSGAGLRGLDDRVAAVGGRLVLASDAGRGTTVAVELPCGS